MTELSVGGEEAETLGKRPAGWVEHWWTAPKHFRLTWLLWPPAMH